MDREQMAGAIARVLDAFSCPEIEAVVDIGDGTVGIQSTDGERFFMEVQDV